MTEHRRIKDLFLAAREMPSEERDAWLAEHCDDDDLRCEVQAMLAADEEMPEGYLEASPRLGLKPGSTVSHYQVLDLLGTGGSGEVYRAHDEQLDRDVAIKVLPAPDSSDREARARLLREARAAAALNHPNICTVHEVNEADGRIYIAMELLEGETLSELIPPRGFPAERAVSYGAQIAEALEHAHERGVIHRDLKPANVVVTPDGRLKVLDFGVAKRALGGIDMEAKPTESWLTTEGTIRGTPPYMAPEQLRAESVDRRCDIWALGAILYEMVSGEPPFQGRTWPELSAAILGQEPKPLSTRVPARLRTIIARCLEKNIDRRYPTAVALLTDLEAATPGVTPRARRALPAPRRSIWRTWRIPISLVGLATAVILGLRVEGLRDRFSGTREATPRSIAVLPFSSVSQDGRDPLLEIGLADTLVAQLSRSSSLRVRSLASAQWFADPDRDPIEAARRLGASYVVEGSTQRHGDRVRVNARLLSVSDGSTIWADTFDEPIDSVFALQDDIVGAVASALAIGTESVPATSLSPCDGANAEAYRAFLTGRYLVGRLTPERLRDSLVAYRRAIDLDPACARAYAGLAWIYRAQVVVSDLDPREYFPLARAAAQQAIAINSGLAEAHAQKGFVEIWYDWNWEAADSTFRHAIALGPSTPEAHLGYAHLLVFLGRFDEAAHHARLAQELDPLTPIMNSVSAGILGAARKADEAEQGLVRALELDETFWHALFVRGGTALDRHDWRGAITDLERAAEGSGRGSLALASLAMSYTAAGEHSRARSILAELEGRADSGYVPATSLAAVHLGLGNVEEALDLLERAYQEHDPRMAWLSVDARWNPLREHPRFLALAERMGLPAGPAYGRF